jgi:AraC-like DNA-binding protein
MSQGRVRTPQHFAHRRSIGSALIHYSPLPEQVAAQLDADSTYLARLFEDRFGPDNEISQALGLIRTREMAAA